ncbi:hypothetical protein LTR66_006191 [Elasticomyces elasticus]|nr:hypothetical protein LTR66_006191 [Elasticomyces elasticus]
MPITCRTVYYDFTITNSTIAPDGIERIGLLVNNQFPGPVLEANWGDTIVVKITNMLQDNGTSVHFHGMRMNYTNEMDGVPSITQCPIAPGESMTVSFKATNYGSSWYHSHYALQTYSGLFGPMVIHGPTTKEYDEDKGHIILQDWTHASVDKMYTAAEDGTTGGPPVMDNGLINGVNTWGYGANRTGARFEMDFESGQTYLLRIVNVAIQSTFKFMIDGHKFWVISNDFVPIVPYEATTLNVNIGQRYDIIVTADQPIGDYWMRSDNLACTYMIQGNDVKGIIHYAGGLRMEPASTGYNFTNNPLACNDEPMANLVPHVAMNVGAKTKEIDENVLVTVNSHNLYKWTLSGTTFQAQLGDPTLYDILKNDTIPNYSGDLAISVPNLGEWVYLIIESPIPISHPIHLHGHDFYVLAQGTTFPYMGQALQLKNPPRRDVATINMGPTGGYLVLAFYTDNPGVWLMHCHIGWHTAMGFALQIIEGQKDIKKSVQNSCMIEDTCKAWNAWAGDRVVNPGASGV